MPLRLLRPPVEPYRRRWGSSPPPAFDAPARLPAVPKVLTLGEIEDGDFPRGEPILGSWLRVKDRVLLYAPPGVGKSLVAASIALAVPGGGSVFGWKASKARRVLLVDGEMDMGTIKGRLKMLAPAVEGYSRETARENLRVIARDGQPHGQPLPDLGEPSEQAVLLEVVERENPELVILDNLSALATLKDENAAASFDSIGTLLENLRRPGRAVVLIHHATKRRGDGKSATYGTSRGSSRLEGFMETVVSLVPLGFSASLEGAAFRLVWQKLRNGSDGSLRSMEVRLQEDASGESRWKWQAVEDGTTTESNEERIVKMVKSGNHRTLKGIAGACGVAIQTVGRWRDNAIGRGLITKEEWKRCLKGEPLMPVGDPVGGQEALLGNY